MFLVVFEILPLIALILILKLFHNLYIKCNILFFPIRILVAVLFSISLCVYSSTLDDGRAELWEKRVVPGMKQALICSLLCSQEFVEGRKVKWNLWIKSIMTGTRRALFVFSTVPETHKFPLLYAIECAHANVRDELYSFSVCNHSTRRNLATFKRSDLW